MLKLMDSRFRGNDEKGAFKTFYETIKYQIPNTKQIPMTKFRKSEQYLMLEGFGHLILQFEICL